jgi:hypothetical protein
MSWGYDAPDMRCSENGNGSDEVRTMGKRVAGLLLAALLASEGCRAKPPVPPRVPGGVGGTTAGPPAFRIARASWPCLGGSNQGRIDTVGSMPGGILLAILGNGAARGGGREACATNLEQCYRGCSDASLAAEQRMRVEMRAVACGPRCGDGSPAIWTGFGAVVGAQGFVKTIVSMADSGGAVRRGGGRAAGHRGLSCCRRQVRAAHGRGYRPSRPWGRRKRRRSPGAVRPTACGEFVLRASAGEGDRPLERGALSRRTLDRVLWAAYRRRPNAVCHPHAIVTLASDAHPCSPDLLPKRSSSSRLSPRPSGTWGTQADPSQAEAIPVVLAGAA